MRDLLLRAFAVVLAVGGVFWTGRESTHGFGALWEHWWCPLPLVAVVIAILLVLTLAFVPRRPGRA